MQLTLTASEESHNTCNNINPAKNTSLSLYMYRFPLLATSCCVYIKMKFKFMHSSKYTEHYTTRTKHDCISA